MSYLINTNYWPPSPDASYTTLWQWYQETCNATSPSILVGEGTMVLQGW